MKIEFNLFQRLALIFWIPVLIYILFMIYLPIKYVKYNPKTQLNLPEEHKQLLRAVQDVQEIQLLSKPKEIELTMLKINPFYKEIPKLEISVSNTTLLNASLLNTPPLSKPILKLTSVIQIPEKPEKSVCIINNKPYYVGSVVEGYKIYKIGEYYVELKGPKGRIRLEVGGTLPF
jgi:hypothetical protein